MSGFRTSKQGKENADCAFDNDGGNDGGEEDKIPHVVHYECNDFDFETFAVIVKIFNRVYIEAE